MKPQISPIGIPPLEQGDHLTQVEFEKRYEAMAHLKKAELIEGRVYMSAALRLRNHGEPHGRLMAWMGYYKLVTPGLVLADNATVRLDFDNEPQPDIALFLEPELGGQVTISPEDYIEGAPELIAEIAASSASYDLGEKKTVYCRHGVKEYIVWQTYEKRLDWFVLQDGQYGLLSADPDGILKSHVFPGLWLDADALLAKDTARVLQVLQAGIQSSEYDHFKREISTSSGS